MKQSGILFDLDGTLLDTAPEFTHCLNKVLTAQGLDPVTVEALRAHVSFGVRGMLDFGFPNPLSDIERAIHTHQFITHYEAQLGQYTQPFPGIPELLTWIKEHNIPWGIVTNKPGRFAEPLIRQYELLREAPCLITGDSMPVRKPDPAPLLEACRLLDLDPKSSWYVGDALADLQASRQAGLRCAIAHYGYFPAETDLLSWGADRTFEHPQDLIALLPSSC